MAWEESTLEGDIALEFAQFGDMSREEIRLSLRAGQISNYCREMARARRNKTRALVKSICTVCGGEYKELVGRPGPRNKYCGKKCYRKASNATYLARRKQRTRTTMRDLACDDLFSSRAWVGLTLGASWLMSVAYLPVQVPEE